MGQIKFMTALLMTALFAVSIITFAILFGGDNNAQVLLANDSDFSSVGNKIIGNVTSFRADSESSSTDLYETQANPGDEVSAGGNQFKVGPLSLVRMTSDILKTGYKKIFGSDSGFSIFLTSFIALLVIMNALWIYKAWFGRDPD